MKTTTIDGQEIELGGETLRDPDGNRSDILEAAHEAMIPFDDTKAQGYVMRTVTEGFENLKYATDFSMNHIGVVGKARLVASSLGTADLWDSYERGLSGIAEMEDGPNKVHLSKALDATVYMGLAQRAADVAGITSGNLADEFGQSVYKAEVRNEMLWQCLGNAATKSKMESIAAFGPEKLAEMKGWQVEEVADKIATFDEPNAVAQQRNEESQKRKELLKKSEEIAQEREGMRRFYMIRERMTETRPKTIADIRGALEKQFGGAKSSYTREDLLALTKVATQSADKPWDRGDDPGVVRAAKYLRDQPSREGGWENKILEFDPKAPGGLKPNYETHHNSAYLEAVTSVLSYTAIISGRDVKSLLRDMPEFGKENEQEDMPGASGKAVAETEKTPELAEPAGPYAAERKAAREKDGAITYSSRHELGEMLTSEAQRYHANASNASSARLRGAAKATEFALRDVKDPFSEEAFALRDKLIDARSDDGVSSGGRVPAKLLVVQEVARMEKMREDREVDALKESWKSASGNDRDLTNKAGVAMSKAISKLEDTDLDQKQKLVLKTSKRAMAFADGPSTVGRVAAKTGRSVMEMGAALPDHHRVAVRAAIAVGDEITGQKTRKAEAVRS